VVHENILKFIQMFEDATHVFLVLEYCDGGDFSDKLKARPEQPMGPCETVVVGWMRQICAAIEALHGAHIVHRDVNPKNFMLSRGVLKLADLGIAQLLRTANSRLFAKCGTPGYMAPEQYMLPLGAGYHLPVDMWAAGIVLYMMLHGGRHPFMEHGKLNKQEMVRERSEDEKPRRSWNARTIHGIVAPPEKAQTPRSKMSRQTTPATPTTQATPRQMSKTSSHASEATTTSECPSLASEGHSPTSSPRRDLKRTASRARVASMLEGSHCRQQELLDHLLHPDPNKRASATEALRHPWLCNASSPTGSD